MTTSLPSQKPWEHAKHSGSEADPLATRFVASLDIDRRLYKHDIRGSLAHAGMLRQVGLISNDDLQAIQRGLGEIEREIDEQGDRWPGWRIELEDVHMCIEAALIAKVGDPGRKLHTGRSRNDQVATDLVLWLDEASRHLETYINELCRAFVELAEKDGRQVMPSYTHLQRAQPIVVGGELMAWCTLFGSDAWLLSQTLRDKLVNPLGSGAIAGSSLPIDPTLTAGPLGFTEPPTNSIAMTANRDAACDFLYACATIAMHLSRWAEQWILYCTTEFGFLQLADEHTTGSSMMPQKKNPDMLELIRGRVGTPYGALMALLTICKGLPIGYNRDLQEDKRHVFASFDCVCDSLAMATRIVKGARFKPDRIRAFLHAGYLDATMLAEYLVTKGVPFRTSHQITGALVRLADELGMHRLDKLTVEQMQKHCGKIESDVFDWLGADNVVKRYQSAGNAGLSGFEQQLKAWKAKLA
jgi:argininosuccinate lyase